jgi:transcriptional regulator with XRE-family HTH domain
MLGLMPAFAVDASLRTAFGARLRELRKNRGWTLKEVATRLGVRHTHIIKYESGVHAPPLEKIAQFADIYGVTVDYLITGKHPDQTPLTSLPLLERFKALQNAPNHDQETAVSVIDALIAKNRVATALLPVAPRPMSPTG